MLALTLLFFIQNKLKGGGNDFYYPDRAILRRQPSNRLSNFNDSQSLDMLRTQQEQAELRLHQNNAERKNQKN